MKKLLLSIMIVLSVFSLTGCSDNKDEIKTTDGNRFITIEDKYKINLDNGSGTYTMRLFYDKQTDIVYIKAFDGFCPLIGKNKLPMTYTEYTETKK